MTNTYLASLSTEQINQQSETLDTMDGVSIATLMNQQDFLAVSAVQSALPTIGKVIDETAKRIQKGGHLFYLGAGTSGRLGVLDASECPPTFGVPATLVQGIMAGGDHALRHAVEGAEDDDHQGMMDLRERNVSENDVVVAISASGFAPYCIGALDYAKTVGAMTVSLTCNVGSLLASHADYAIEAPTGAEVLMGSTRLKAGTATKMILNMISTGAMVRTGRVYRNLMVDVSISNVKLRDRAIRIIRHATDVSVERASELLDASGSSVKVAIVMHIANVDASCAKTALEAVGGWVTPAIEQLKP